MDVGSFSWSDAYQKGNEEQINKKDMVNFYLGTKRLTVNFSSVQVLVRRFQASIRDDHISLWRKTFVFFCICCG